jgi:hypothetical protein
MPHRAHQSTYHTTRATLRNGCLILIEGMTYWSTIADQNNSLYAISIPHHARAFPTLQSLREPTTFDCHGSLLTGAPWPLLAVRTQSARTMIRNQYATLL